MKISLAKKSDKKEYLKVQKEAFPNLNSKQQSKYFDFKIKNKEIFVAKIDNKYAGHLCFGHHLLNPPFAPSIFLEELAVKKEFRGRGIATKLKKYIEYYCKKNKIPMIYLGTGDYKGNKAIRLYKRLGYKRIGKLKEINPKSDYKHGQVFYGKVVK